MKLVLDSNIYVAAFASHGLCQTLFEHCLEEHEVFISKEILNEVERILLKKIKLPKALVQERLQFIKTQFQFKRARKLKEAVCRDPKDDPILSLAYGEGVDYLITGDKDLLVLESYKNIPILTPRAFWAKITEG